MKKYALMLSLLVGTANAHVSSLVVRAPIVYVEQDVIDEAAKEWAAQCVQTLSQEELQVVSRTLHLGANFSDLDWRVRRMMRAIFAATWCVHQQIIKGEGTEHVTHKLKENYEKLYEVLGLHGIVFREWRAWTNMLAVCKNESLLTRLELVNDQVRDAIYRCLQAEDWHNIAYKAAPIIEQSLKSLYLLRQVCQSSTKSEFVEDVASLANEELAQGWTAWMAFDMLAKAASQGVVGSWKSLEAASQISIYEEALLEISYTIYRAYHEVLNEAIAHNNNSYEA